VSDVPRTFRAVLRGEHGHKLRPGLSSVLRYRGVDPKSSRGQARRAGLRRRRPDDGYGHDFADRGAIPGAGGRDCDGGGGVRGLLRAPESKSLSGRAGAGGAQEKR
ncbi:unnamed protein product, partial [Ectocarpus sp. 8 AP-2014]